MKKKKKKKKPKTLLNGGKFSPGLADLQEYESQIKQSNQVSVFVDVKVPYCLLVRQLKRRWSGE